MRVALNDVDGHNFLNLPLMKMSAYHKQLGDTVEWYDPLKRLQRWVNSRFAFAACERFEDYTG